MDKDIGQRVLEALEAVNFGFNQKTNGFPIDVSNPDTKSYVRLLVYDIGIFLKGDIQEPRYSAAKIRLMETKVDLYSYARFLCKKFNIVPFSVNSPTIQPAYKIPENLQTLVDMWDP